MEKENKIQFIIQPNLYQISLQINQKLAFKIYESTKYINFIQNLKVFFSIEEKDIKIQRREEISISKELENMIPITLLVETFDFIFIKGVKYLVEIQIQNPSQEDKDQNLLFTIQEFDHNIFQKTLNWKMIKSQSIKKTKFCQKGGIVSVFGKINSGKSRLLLEFLSDERLFENQTLKTPFVGYQDHSMTTHNTYLFEREVKDKDSLMNIKCIDIEGISGASISVRRKNVTYQIAKLIYSISDVILVVTSIENARETIDLLFEGVKNVELKEKPEIILCINQINGNEKDKENFEKGLNQMTSISFSFHKYVWIPSCIDNGELFQKKIKQLNDEIFNSLKKQSKLKKQHLLPQNWFSFVKKVVYKSNEDVFDILGKMKQHPYQMAIYLFDHLFNSNNLSYYMSCLICSKFMALKKVTSLYERKRLVTYFKTKVPKKFDYFYLEIDFTGILDLYYHQYMNKSEDEVFLLLQVLMQGNYSLKQILFEIDEELKFLKVWKIRDEEAGKFYNKLTNYSNFDSKCSVCIENMSEIFLYKCKHFICKECCKEMKSIHQSFCPICKKEILIDVEYVIFVFLMF